VTGRQPTSMHILELFPAGTRVDERGDLILGGHRAGALAAEYGTPLYVFDEPTLSARCRAYRDAWAQAYPGSSRVAYAGKAYLNVVLAQIIHREGLDLDVVSGGELFLALQAGFPPERIHFHGNNKSAAELALALDAGVGRLVVDNLDELRQLDQMTAARGERVGVWIRVSPGMDAHTHAYNQTGAVDSKFGFLWNGPALREVLGRLQAHPHLRLVGLHAHVGSQIWDLSLLAESAGRLVDLAADLGRPIEELSPGGGLAVPYTTDDPVVPVSACADRVAAAIVERCRRHRLPLPRVVVEPGRSLIAQAGVALYAVGARKSIPGTREYVSLDGGMADNIRPALYNARYSALLANQADRPGAQVVTLAGRFCESGDVLVRDVALPPLEPGDLVAIPMVGAYCLPLASNYNLVPRPAVVLLRPGRTDLIQRRETWQDLINRDQPVALS